MTTLKKLFVAFIVTALMTNAFGQPASQKKSKGTLRDRMNQSSFIQKKLASGDYSFSQTTGTYTELTNPISINNGQVWDDLMATIPIGFSFKLYDVMLDSVYFGIGLGGLVTSAIDQSFEADYAMLPFEVDLIDRGELSGISLSPISYQLEGIAGSRILKIEWKNAGFMGEIETLGTLNDYANFQLWLYEGSSDIEMHYGPIMVSDPVLNYKGETGAYAGVSDMELVNSYLLMGNPENPALSDTLVTLDGTPANGTVYRFSNLTTGDDGEQPENPVVRFFPNPVRQIATVRVSQGSLTQGELQLRDSFGRMVNTIRNIRANEFSIDCTDLVRGVYIFQLTDQEKFIARGKLVVD